MLNHPHPCSFRLFRALDRGWGEMAFEYRWESTSGVKGEDGLSNPDLDACVLYEYTTYADNSGYYTDEYFYPPSPPFTDWKFRHPTDGRTAPVALGCFPATQGWAWDRHKLGGKLALPPEPSTQAAGITAIQQYRYTCRLCGQDEIIPGSHSGPHAIHRMFSPCRPSYFEEHARDAPLSADSNSPAPVWRYTLRKHDSEAYMDVGLRGYIDDSAHIGFGPF